MFPFSVIMGIREGKGPFLLQMNYTFPTPPCSSPPGASPTPSGLQQQGSHSSPEHTTPASSRWLWNHSSGIQKRAFSVLVQATLFS